MICSCRLNIENSACFSSMSTVGYQRSACQCAVMTGRHCGGKGEKHSLKRSSLKYGKQTKCIAMQLFFSEVVYSLSAFFVLLLYLW